MASLMLGCCTLCCDALPWDEAGNKEWESYPALRQYNVLKRIGEGGFSEVYLAEDTASGRHVALKVVSLARPGLTPAQRDVLAGEARLLRMVNHRNILKCFDVCKTKRQQVMVLEHLTGGEMLHELHSIDHYSEAAACQLIQQVVEAVAYLHSLGLMHRDLKPENIMLAKPSSHYIAKGKPMRVVLLDLGMAGVYMPQRPQRGCMGSPGFIAPEVIRGGKHTPAMDVYSLGVLLFVMLCGRKPWDPSEVDTLAYAGLSISASPGITDKRFLGVSEAARQLLLAMLSDRARDRPTASAVLKHPWVVSGGGEAHHLIHEDVRRRISRLMAHRQHHGTAHAMLAYPHTGSRAAAAKFHRAVQQAREQARVQAKQQHASALQPQTQHPEHRHGHSMSHSSSTGSLAPCQQQQQQQEQEHEEPQIQAVCNKKSWHRRVQSTPPAMHVQQLATQPHHHARPSTPFAQELPPEHQQTEACTGAGSAYEQAATAAAATAATAARAQAASLPLAIPMQRGMSTPEPYDTRHTDDHGPRALSMSPTALLLAAAEDIKARTARSSTEDACSMEPGASLTLDELMGSLKQAMYMGSPKALCTGSTEPRSPNACSLEPACPNLMMMACCASSNNKQPPVCGAMAANANAAANAAANVAANVAEGAASSCSTGSDTVDASNKDAATAGMDDVMFSMDAATAGSKGAATADAHAATAFSAPAIQQHPLLVMHPRPSVGFGVAQWAVKQHA